MSEINERIEKIEITKEEFFNTQARINVLSSVVIDLVSVISLNQPQYSNELIDKIFQKWETAEEEYPMQVDKME